jgi:hypothetical protein
MATDNDCVGYARECVRLAGLTDPQLREQLLRMAREWMAMAMHEPAPNSGAAGNWTWLNKFKLKGWFGAAPARTVHGPNN